jgi:MtN3 and saliva related transmembrane protein
MSSNTNILIIFCGYLGSLLLAINSIPQVFKSYKTKSTKDISYAYQCFILCGLILNTIYTMYHNILPIMIGNCIEFILMFLLLFQKIYYDKLAKQTNTQHTDQQINRPTHIKHNGR